MDITRLVDLLRWPTVIVFLALTFRKPISELFWRLGSFSLNIGGDKGFRARLAALPQRRAGKINEPKAHERIDTELLVLRDSNGRERAKLGMTDTDSACLTFYDLGGGERLSIWVHPNGASAVTLYGDGNREVLLGTGELCGLVITANDQRAAGLVFDSNSEVIFEQGARREKPTKPER